VESVKTLTFGKTMAAFDDLHKEVVMDYDSKKDLAILDPKNKTKKINAAVTELFFKKTTASCLYVKRRAATDLFSHTDNDDDKIAAYLFTLFEDSSTKERLLKTYENYNYLVLKAYKSFLTEITRLNIYLQVSWVDENNSTVFEKTFTADIARVIIDNIAEIHAVQANSKMVQGKFLAINCKNRSFTFSSVGEEYKGRFDAQSQLNVKLADLNFASIYKVSIQQQEIEEAIKDLTVKNVITSIESL
jgi:hypothetical protein